MEKFWRNLGFLSTLIFGNLSAPALSSQCRYASPPTLPKKLDYLKSERSAKLDFA
jgi:hypothetical protein